MSDHTGEIRPIRVLLLDLKDRLFLLRGQDPVPKADYDMTIINHVEPRDIAALWANPTYYTRYNNPAVQSLLAKGDAGTATEFVDDYKKAVQLLANDAAAAWL